MSLFSRTLHDLAAQASTLDERLRGDVLLPGDGEGTAHAGRRLARWQQALGGDGAARLRRRLTWDGETPEHARALVDDVRWHADRPLPTWAALLDDVARWPDGPAHATADASLDMAAMTSAVPFAELLEPIVAAARRLLVARVTPGARVAPRVVDDAAEALRRHLGAIAGRTLLAEFDLFRLRRGVLHQWPGAAPERVAYRAFVGDEPRERLFAVAGRFPVLARLLATRALLWVDSTAELLARLDADAPSIGRAFGIADGEWPVAAVRGGLSDSHRGGRSVAILELASGRALVYKPRAVAVDRAWSDLLAWLDAARDGAPHRRLRVLDRREYGWVEFAEHAPCADEVAVERYFRRAGSLLCLTYVLGASDLHLGNVIASGEHPVLVDLEVLFATPVDWSGKPRDDAQWRDVQQLWDSVLRSGLLPQRFRLAGDRTANLAGLTGSGDGVTVGSTEWVRVNTDGMAMRRTTTALPSANLPMLDGARVDPARFEHALVAGFEETYEIVRRRRRALLAPRGPLAAFRETSARVVLRTTDIYAALLERTLHPRYLASGVERSIELETLAVGALHDDVRPGLSAVAAAERRGLEQLDVPLFTARVGEAILRDDADRAIGAHAPSSGYEGAERRVRALCESDRRRQVDLIQLSLRTASAHDPSPDAAIAPADDALRPVVEAQRIVDSLRTARIPDAEGGHWVGFVRLPDARHAGLREVGPTLKDGRCGIALFLAAHARITGDEDARAMALTALAPVLRVVEAPARRRALADALGIGGAGGVGGIVYALATAATLLDEPSLLRAATLAARAITRERVARDAALDLCYGAAGAALGLAALAERTGDGAPLRQARWCGERLLDAAVSLDDDSLGWRTSGAAPTLGVAHGAAGIAHALRRLHAALGDARYLHAARRAQRLVRAGIREGAERAARGAPTGADHAWCRGAVGGGLASVAAIALGDDDPALVDDVTTACTVAASGPASATDHPCCGNMGRVELLLSAAVQRGAPPTRAHALAREVVERARRGGYATGAPTTLTPGLFQGIAGIGYELLRLAHPHVLPPFLLWR